MRSSLSSSPPAAAVADLSPELSSGLAWSAGPSTLSESFASATPSAVWLAWGRWWRAAVQRVLPWLVPVLLLVVWQAASSLGWLSTRVLPSPWQVVEAFWALSSSGELWTHVKVSAWRALTGLAIGGGLGLVLGLLTGSSKLAETLLDSSVQMVRNIPALALIPLVILWFGIEEEAKLFLIAVSVFFPIYLNTFHGIRNVDPGLVEMGRTYGLDRWQLYTQIVLPGALSSILVGLRFSLGLMWVILIVAETISAQAGIGYLTMNAREFLQTDVVLVGILLYAALGKLADVFAKALERHWLRWHPGYQGTNAQKS
ncbi:ABC transporter permease [Hydrogenophaga soli]